MAYQLVYTSSPRGLKPGAFGFCIVACTRGMKEQTTSALEALSGYRRIFADPRDASRNPTAYSHVLFETATGRLRILARVADAGLDYSGRTNKIASFLDVASGELTPPGPAALFSAPGLFVANWSSENAPQYYETPIALPNSVPIPSGCGEWRGTTGDAAWAGVLASTVASRRSVFLVVRSDQNVLRLFQESLALLPPGERWNATFSTYYMKTPPGVQCQWKAVMQGSPEESALRSTPGALVLDLTAPNRLPSVASLAATPEAQALVAAARGLAPAVAVPTQFPERTVQTVPNAATPPPAFGGSSLPGAAPIGGTTPYDLASPVPPSPTPGRKTLNYGRDAILAVTPPPQRGDRKTALLTKILACVGAAAILFGIVVAIMCVNGFFYQFKKAVDEREKAAAEASGLSGETATPESSTPIPDSDSLNVDESLKEESEDSKSPGNNLDVRLTSTDADNPEEEPLTTTVRQTTQTQEKTPKVPKDSEKKQNTLDIANKIVQNDERENNGISDEEDVAESSVANDKKTSEVKKDVKNDDSLDDVAHNIEMSLVTFVKEGGVNDFKKIERFIEKYRSKVGDSNELKESIAKFDKIAEALKFSSLQCLIMKGEKVKNLSADEEPKVEELALYRDLTKFFTNFPTGTVRLTFRLYDELGQDSEFPCDVVAKDFRNRPDPPMIEKSLGNESSDVFYIDLSRRLGGVSFQSEKSLRKWLLGGTVEVDAFANESPGESTLVYHAPEAPLLDGSDLTTDFSAVDSFKLAWLFGRELSSVPFSDADGSSLFIEYVPNEGSTLSVVTSPKEVKKIVPTKSIANNKSLTVLKGKERSRGTFGNQSEFAISVSFFSKKNEIKQDGTIHLHRIKKGNWIEDSQDSPPDGLDERVLKFRIRYRAYKDQKLENMPIVGVLKVPIDFN